MKIMMNNMVRIMGKPLKIRKATFKWLEGLCWACARMTQGKGASDGYLSRAPTIVNHSELSKALVAPSHVYVCCTAWIVNSEPLVIRESSTGPLHLSRALRNPAPVHYWLVLTKTRMSFQARKYDILSP